MVFSAGGNASADDDHVVVQLVVVFPSDDAADWACGSANWFGDVFAAEVLDDDASADEFAVEDGVPMTAIAGARCERGGNEQFLSLSLSLSLSRHCPWV